MAIGTSQYAQWAATPAGATAILKKYQAPDERGGQTASSPDSLTPEQVKELILYQEKFEYNRYYREAVRTQRSLGIRPLP
jgi:hypothetical protein